MVSNVSDNSRLLFFFFFALLLLFCATFHHDVETNRTQVDRSAAYAARWVAKSLVSAGLCHRVLVQLSYAIGVPYPLSIHVDSYGTAKTRSGKSDEDLVEIINNNFDLRPGCLLRDLSLRRPIFQKTAAYGHFGRADADFTWEVPKDLTL